jgi:hypothetical protein
MFRLLSTSAVLVSCLFAAGCSDDDPIAAPIDPPVQISETFTGTLNVNSAAMHTFVTDRAGQLVATIDSLSPTSGAIVSYILGTWNGSYCQVILVKDDATSGSILVGNASAGAFCVRVADIGRLTESTSYSITVQHY